MNAAIGGSKSKDHSPKNSEKEDEDKHKQREKTAYVPPPSSFIITADFGWQRSSHP
jgi:hypothetical protein